MSNSVLGMKYIKEIKPGTYRIHMRIGKSLDGKNLYDTKQLSNVSLRDVQKLRDEMWKNRDGKMGIDSNIKVVDFARMYLQDHAFHSHTGTTYDSEESKLRNHVIPYLGNYKMKDITPMIIQKLINFLVEKDSLRHDKEGNVVKLNATTIRNIYNIVCAMFTKAVELKIITSTPCTGITLPRGSKYQATVYNIDEMNNLLECFQDSQLSIQNKCIFVLAMSTGMRRGELGGLLKEDIDFENKIVYIRNSLSQSKSKGEELKDTKSEASVRPIGLNDISIEMLKLHLKEQERLKKNSQVKWPNIPNVFTDEFGNPISLNSITHSWSRFILRHKLKYVRLHGLRASFATFLAYKGYPPKVVQALLGHASERTTMKFYQFAYEGYATSILDTTNEIGKK